MQGLSPVDKPTFIPSGITGTHPCTTVCAASRTCISISSSPASTALIESTAHQSCTCASRLPTCTSHEAQKDSGITCAATATQGCICVRWRCCACCRIVDMEYVIVCVLCQVKSQHFTRQTQRMGEYKCNAYVLCQCLLHKVHRHLNLPCSQIPLPPQSAHLLFCLPCMQRAPPPQSEHQCRCLL